MTIELHNSSGILIYSLTLTKTSNSVIMDAKLHKVPLKHLIATLPPEKQSLCKYLFDELNNIPKWTGRDMSRRIDRAIRNVANLYKLNTEIK